MRLSILKYLGLCLLLAIPVAVTGCDGDGYEWPAPLGDSSGVPDDQEPGDGGDGTDGGDTDSPDVVVPDTSTDTRFKGSWLASFSDEYSSDGKQYVYAIHLTLVRGLFGRLTGDARVTRFSWSGDEWEEFEADVVNGSRDGDYGQLDLKAAKFSPRPSLYLRSADDRIVGLFVAYDGNTLERASAVTWHKAGSGTIEGDWVGAVRDARSSRDAAVEDSGLLRDRRAGVTFNVPLSKAWVDLSGTGDFVELRDTGSLAYVGFDVVDGKYDASKAVFTGDPWYWEEGKAVIPDAPMDWSGRFNSDVYAGVFAQLNPAREWTRYGHATWYKQPDTLDSNLVTANWITAFSDTISADGDLHSYVGVMKLELETGGNVNPTGASFRQELGPDDSSYLSYNTTSGSMESKGDIHLELKSSRDTFVWDLYLTGSLLVGVYERVSSANEFLSRGIAEWRIRQTPAFKGTWAASYNDAQATDATNKRPSLAYVRVDDGETSGNGNVLAAGDEAPLSFNFSPKVDGNKVDWTWGEQGKLSGQTVWHLRCADTILVGTYTNYNDVGDEEHRGHAVWARTDSD